MNTVFIGGSRHVSRLPAPAKERLDNIVKSGFHIVVGDANGADKAVQKATPEEWSLPSAPQPDLLDLVKASTTSSEPAPPDLDVEINQALGAGDSRRFVELLGTIARDHGMSQVAKDSGLARESLYRSLGADGNPEFATVLKVLASLGLTLTATRAA
jgi:probable addiction module antidote protein